MIAALLALTLVTSKIDRAAERIAGWRRDPVQFVVDEFQTQPDDWQVEGLRAFADPEQHRIAFKANKGPGKTAELAWMIWNFMSCHGERGAHPKGKCTGISEQNLNDNLWTELAKWRERSDYLKREFEITKTRIQARAHPDTWWFAKQPWPRSGDQQSQANTLAGLHERNILFVLDESGGIPRAVMATAEAALANPGGFKKIVQAGNPTHTEGPLWDACSTHRHLWTVIEITGDPDDPRRSKRVSETWARQQIEMYGRDNPWVLVNVFGQFPPSSLNALLGPDDVNAAMKRNPPLTDYEWAQKRLGVDVARFGDDRTVLFPRQGIMTFNPEIMRVSNTVQIAARVMLAKRNWGQELEFIDDTGHWGHGVYDNLLTAGHAPVAIQFHGPASEQRYANKRAEMWLKMADWVKRGGCLPPIPELVAELTVPEYSFTTSGKFIIQDKDIIKEKLGRSPDLADALALTFAYPDMPADVSLRLGMGASRGGKMASDYEPLERVGSGGMLS